MLDFVTASNSSREHVTIHVVAVFEVKDGKLTLLLANVPGPSLAIDLNQLDEAAVDQATIC